MWILIILGSMVFNYFYLKCLAKSRKKSGKVEDYDQDQNGINKFNPVDFESSEEHLGGPTGII